MEPEGADMVNYFAESTDLMGKYDLIKFFETRSYRQLTSYQDVIEADFVETLFHQRDHYRKQGVLAGVILSYVGWDTFMRRFLLMNKFIFALAAVKAGCELALYYHLDEIYNPLRYIYTRYYSSSQIDKTN